MGWSLDQVHDLDADDYDQLIEWIRDRNEKRSGDDSVDMDRVIADTTRQEATDGSE